MTSQALVNVLQASKPKNLMASENSKMQSNTMNEKHKQKVQVTVAKYLGEYFLTFLSRANFLKVSTMALWTLFNIH